MDQGQLVAKYAEMGVDTSRILPVDYVWSGERYRDLVGDVRFDWIVASHVVEHVPDLVGFVNECTEILAPGGALSLVVPDKRATFDYHRPPSGLGAVVDAHLAGRRISSPGATAEFELYIADYHADALAPPFMQQDIEHACNMMARAARGEYHDVHAWVFTPSSFRLLVEDLHRLGLLQAREAAFVEGEDEFYVQLSREGAGPDLDRLALSTRAVDELRGACEIERLVRRNIALRGELEATRRTLSWRLTAPLRAIRRGLP
jgi:hypothetical protein